MDYPRPQLQSSNWSSLNGPCNFAFDDALAYGAPTCGEPHPESHLHAEFYPPYRSSDQLKYLAGTELGAGRFANDAPPEQKAQELQGVQVTL